jgi:NAD-dependent SIR2 family protein deacetylase
LQKQSKKPKLELRITQNISQLFKKLNLKETRVLESRKKQKFGWSNAE